MINYFDKENVEKINFLNQALGMSHRTKPIDLNNVDDLKEAFMLSVGEYFDYSEYWGTIVEIDEQFDESIEYYDPATWMNLTTDIEKADDLIVEAISSLADTSNVLKELVNRAETKLKKILEIILNSDDCFQDVILG
ncbi:hypothetical protein GC105_10005 [Alkalibaculum sp. M08DMB]|uniref:Uncharacterized protein n=1 Tax=Alkalibaculum sporogenes TaxID=2655001 RepID=A0A6A7K9L9_9FIRM|nr:hypothetical protein [Alkalibaculum sporogenes]MPW26124.1 hypothetical protein [Alkalibaculum sporogenes]